MPDCAFCVHGHFYQPPRIDPFNGHIPREPDAAPYANWNERITAESYAPLARAGHFERISFNLGATLARWLDEHEHAVYARIVSDTQAYHAAHGVGNGLAQPVHHTILPLAHRRDKICQVRWGIESFVHRFGYRPQGMWLPEMAVDLETLDVLAAHDIRFTILSDEQVIGDLQVGAGPYRVRLSHGAEIAVFVRDRHLSNNLSFQMPHPEGVDDWMREQLDWRCQPDRLVLVATDGETFGHHHRQGAEVMSRMLDAVPRWSECTLTTLGHYLEQHPPRYQAKVIENTAWSCSHRIDRWVVGCDCTPGDSRWKGALRRALDNLACDLDGIYVREVAGFGVAPWPLRDNYIAVVLGQSSGPQFLVDAGLDSLSQRDEERLLWLLEAQFYRQRMYASCTFFFEDLERYEPRYAIGNAIRAMALTRYATGDDLTTGFRRDLSVAVSAHTGRNGADMFDDLVR